MIQENEFDIIIVGTGVAGLYCALQLPEDKSILLITKSSVSESDSFLAQGGICVLKEENDYDSFYADTMKAGHYENDSSSVHFMIIKSQEAIGDLLSYGVEFEQENGQYVYTKEGAHSVARILYHDDLTGKEITSKLLSRVQQRKNITLLEHTEMLDLLCDSNTCSGIILRNDVGDILTQHAKYVVMATGGLGGLFEHSTNYPHLTGDAIAIAKMHNIIMKNVDYIQIHPTTLYSKKPGRRFLISESVRGEGGILLNKQLERFVDELLPRDMLTEAVYQQMKRDNTDHVWLSLEKLGIDHIQKRFPNIYHHCLAEGFDITRQSIPVVPAQHYLMGGLKVDLNGETSMKRLYAIGETSCNGVHGANRLASNSLLESLVFAKSAALHITNTFKPLSSTAITPSIKLYEDIDQLHSINKQIVMEEIERSKCIVQHGKHQTKCG